MIRKQKILFYIPFLFATLCKAQNAVLSAGGDGVSTECSFSYSVGQIDYTSISDNNIVLINLGVQQPLLILPVLTVPSIYSDFIPNAFTPSSADGNAYWNLSNVFLPDNAIVTIFNRHGILVYEATGKEAKEKPWDGGTLPASAYWYTIDRKNGSKVLTGSVTILK